MTIVCNGGWKTNNQINGGWKSNVLLSSEGESRPVKRKPDRYGDMRDDSKRKKKSKKPKSKPVVVSGTRIGKQLEELKNLKIDCERKCRTKACRKKYKKQCKTKILTTENPLSRGNLRNSIFKMLKFEKIGNPLFRYNGEKF